MQYCRLYPNSERPTGTCQPRCCPPLCLFASFLFSLLCISRVFASSIRPRSPRWPDPRRPRSHHSSRPLYTLAIATRSVRSVTSYNYPLISPRLCASSPNATTRLVLSSPLLFSNPISPIHTGVSGNSPEKYPRDHALLALSSTVTFLPVVARISPSTSLHHADAFTPLQSVNTSIRSHLHISQIKYLNVLFTT